MTVDYTQFDAESPLSGEYISPTWQRDEDESDLAEALAHAFVAAVIVAKAWDWSGLAKKWSERGFRDEDLDPVHKRFTEALKRTVGNLLLHAAGLGRQQALMDFEAEFPKKDWRALASPWAQVYGNEMANQIADQSHKGLAQVVPQLINGGLRNDSLAQQVKVFYGLDPRSATSVLNFMGNKDKPRNKTALDVAAELLTRRAKVIGDVQSFTGLNFGRQLTYMEAMDAGLLPKSARKVWVTAIDERVCKICKPMDGRMVGLLDTFAIPTQAGTIRLLVPPVHPNCRCTVVPEERYRHGIITRTARFKDDAGHRSRLRSEVEDLVSLGKAASEPVEKFSPLQLRDAFGRFAPLAGAAAATYVVGTNFPKVTNPQPKLPRHLKRVDRKVRSGKNGTYLVPRQYLDFHQRGQSFRIGNEAHINDMAREFRQSGYKMKPVTLHVYDDVVEVADGNHRVEAAYRARLGFVPTKIVHIPGKKPVQRGVIPAWRQSRTNEARRVAASRYVGSLDEQRRNPFRRLNQRLIAQDEKKHQWHDKNRKRTIKPLMVGKLFDPSEERDSLGRWVDSHEGQLLAGAEIGLGVAAISAASLANPKVREFYRLATGGIANIADINIAPEAVVPNGRLAGIFHGFTHSGLTANVTRTYRWPGSTMVTGQITSASGRPVGIFTRNFDTRAKTVEHSLFEIDRSHRGTGFGSAFVTHSFDEYRRMGYKTVKVHANIDVGGYTWASMGFKFSNPRGEAGLISKLAHAERYRWVTDDEIALFHEMAETMRRNGGTPQDIIRIGIDRTWEERGQTMWAGKKLMLGTDWMGVYTL